MFPSASATCSAVWSSNAASSSLAPLGGGEHPPGPVHGEARAGAGAEAGQAGVAGPPAGVRQARSPSPRRRQATNPPTRRRRRPEHGGGTDERPGETRRNPTQSPPAEEVGRDRPGPAPAAAGDRYLAAVSDVVTWATAATLVLGFGSGSWPACSASAGGDHRPRRSGCSGATPIQAVGSTVPAIMPGSISGAYRYWREGLVDWRVGLICGGTGALFAAAGAKLDDLIDGHYLMILTAGAAGLQRGVDHPIADGAGRRETPAGGRPRGRPGRGHRRTCHSSDPFRHPG